MPCTCHCEPVTTSCCWRWLKCSADGGSRRNSSRPPSRVLDWRDDEPVGAVSDERPEVWLIAHSPSLIAHSKSPDSTTDCVATIASLDFAPQLFVRRTKSRGDL